VTASVQRVFARELLRSSRDLVAETPVADAAAARAREAELVLDRNSVSNRAAATAGSVKPPPFDDPSLSVIGDL
jgi:hypothetical protein